MPILKNFTAKIIKKIVNRLDYSGGDLRKKKNHAYPFSIFVVSITTRCNFNCPHCLRQQVDQNKTLLKDLPVPVFETILKEGRKINFRFISFTGGEPILHPHFGELVSLVKKYGYVFNFVSNGWLHKEYWEIIKPNRENLKAISLSLDGATAEVHDAIRQQPGSFKRLVEAAKFYRERNLPVMVTFCLIKKNYHQIKALLDFCLNLGVKSIKWTTVFPVPGSGVFDPREILTDDERTEACRQIFNLRQKLKGRCNFLIASSFYSYSGISNRAAINRKKLGIDFCPALDNHLFFIDHEGGVFFCCDITQDCPEKPLIQEIGFEKSLKIAMDTAQGIKKKFLSELLNNPQKVNRICDFCNENIKFCLDSATKHYN